MADNIQRSIILVDYVEDGIPSPENFTVFEEDFDIAEALRSCPVDGVVLQNLVLSADPYQRLSIRKNGHIDQMVPGQPMKGVLAGKVLASRSDKWRVGDLYGGILPFQTYVVLDAAQVRTVFMYNLSGYVNESNISLGIGLFGLAGSGAYAAMIGLFKTKPKRTIYISAAAGAVGSIAGMIAKNVCGLRVIGSCGGPEKCEMIRQKFGFDVSIDYKELRTKEDFVAALQLAAPDGIDYFLDNVGGMGFSAAMEVLRPQGHCVISGLISHYSDANCENVDINPMKMVFGQQKVEGFLCFDYLGGAKGNFLLDMSRWLAEGKIKQEETVWEGMENWGEAFQSLFIGGNKGKVVVRL